MMSKLFLDEDFISVLTKRLSIMIEADERVSQGDKRRDISNLRDKDIEKEGCLRAALYQVKVCLNYVIVKATTECSYKANIVASFCT